jgi:lysozyme family protein
VATVPFTDALSTEYTNLFAACVPANLGAVDAVANVIVANQSRYQSVGTALSIPWYFIGAIHHMESSNSFTRHLHNGDPLTARTVHVPAGRPPDGNPPFTWEQSALDALKMRHLDQVTNWTLPGVLYQMEGYNGFGYRLYHPAVLTPYLWSSSNQYTKGKYVADGKFDPDAVSGQIGAAVVLRRMVDRQLVTLDS